MKSKPRNHLSKMILFGWMIFLMEGCTPIASPSTSENISSTQSEPATEIQGVVTQMNTSETPSASSLEGLIEKAKDDLAQRLSISATQINVIEAKAVTWSDSSLGCPQPGMAYLQVITPGYRILLEANAQVYEYHTNKNTYIIYCPNPIPPIFASPNQ